MLNSLVVHINLSGNKTQEPSSRPLDSSMCSTAYVAASMTRGHAWSFSNTEAFSHTEAFSQLSLIQYRRTRLGMPARAADQICITQTRKTRRGATKTDVRLTSEQRIQSAY